MWVHFIVIPFPPLLLPFLPLPHLLFVPLLLSSSSFPSPSLLLFLLFPSPLPLIIWATWKQNAFPLVTVNPCGDDFRGSGNEVEDGAGKHRPITVGSGEYRRCPRNPVKSSALSERHSCNARILISPSLLCRYFMATLFLSLLLAQEPYTSYQWILLAGQIASHLGPQKAGYSLGSTSVVPGWFSESTPTFLLGSGS